MKAAQEILFSQVYNQELTKEEKEIHYQQIGFTGKQILDAMKEYASQALNLAAENAQTYLVQQDFIDGKYIDRIEVNRQTILQVKDLLI